MPTARTAGAGGEAKLPATLDDYGLVGNLHTTALVSRDGSVDWACLPRFASPSVFGRLLDAAKGGHASVRPVGAYRATQSYVRGSALLTTRFELGPGRRLELTDFMPVLEGEGPEGASVIVRRLRAVGEVGPVAWEFAPAFDFGRRAHTWSRYRSLWVARSGKERVEFSAPSMRFAPAGRALRGETTLRPGATYWSEVVWGRRPPHLPAAPELLRTTEAFWRSWSHSPRSSAHQLARRWHRWVLRSEVTLKLLSHADTGAFVAAPTTSLPEVPGGVRNWDYRYVWIRDAAFTAQALLLLGHRREARSFLRWVLSRVRQEGGRRLRVMYGAHGESDLRERELPHWSGFLGSRPVRIGNGAAGQFQLDIYGELFDAAALLEQVDGPGPVAEHWDELAELATVVVRRWRYPDHGIWEVRDRPREFVHSKLMAWVALDRAATLAGRYGTAVQAESWSNEAQKVRAWILGEGFDAARATFLQAAGEPAVDAANLRIPMVGFLPFDDPAVLGTIDAVTEELCDGPFVYRYLASDGLPGKEGAFLPASFWLVECLARAGRLEAAVDHWDQLVRAGNALDLFSEEFDPRTRAKVGNFPQALTHVALLRAALSLGEERAGVSAKAAIAERADPSGLATHPLNAGTS